MQLIDEARFSLNETAKKLDVHVATLWRWTLRGIRGRKLRTILIGGRRYVLARDLEAFLAAPCDQPRALSDPELQRRADAAGRQLDAYGVWKTKA